MRNAVNRSVVFALVIFVAAMAALLGTEATAHGVADDDKAFIESTSGTQLAPFIYLGAKHMVTGYDHLLFLVGVIFFLYRSRDAFQAPFAGTHGWFWRNRGAVPVTVRVKTSGYYEKLFKP